MPKSASSSRISAQRCQCPQRLWKVLHRDDPQPVGIAPGLARVLAGRDEEGVHTRLARAPNVFCFTPPIGPTVPSRAISPVAAILCPCVTLRPSSWRMSSAKASPADGPPTPPASILILHRQLDRRGCRAQRRRRAPASGPAGRRRLDRHRPPLAVADERDRGRRRRAGAWRARARRLATEETLWPSAATITSLVRRTFAAGAPFSTSTIVTPPASRLAPCSRGGRARRRRRPSATRSCPGRRSAARPPS